MAEIIYAALFLPLAGFIGLTSVYRFIDRKTTGFIACATIFISFICFLTLLASYLMNGMEPQNFTLFTWLPVKGIHADFTLHLDSLSLLMALIITGVGFLIHVYSNGYMDHE